MDFLDVFTQAANGHSDRSGKEATEDEAPRRLVRKRYQVSDAPLLEWLDCRADFLSGLMAYKVPSENVKAQCGYCDSVHDPLYRCLDCFGLSMRCGQCMLNNHATQPLHRLEANSVTIQFLGLRTLQSSTPMGYTRSISTSVGVAMLNHESSNSSHFNLLRNFDILQLQSKLSAYDFYKALEQITENASMESNADRYMPFSCVAHRWTHLKMLKCGGYGDCMSFKDIPDGGLAVLCPACPQPEWNLPVNWKDAPPEQKWLYRWQIAVDANFKLKRKKVSSLKVNPGFGPGWSYMVEPKKYRAHTSGAEYPKEENTCSGFRSVDDSEKTGGVGIETCGVGGTICPRHSFVYPNGIGDLPGCESYRNMDYIIFSALEHMQADEVDISYDLLLNNLKKPAKSAKIRFFIPKFHAPAHIKDCQTTCSWYLLPRVAETDGEEIERFWSGQNSAGNAMQEMAPGNRWDLLNAFFGDWNWCKALKLGESLRKLLLEVIKEAPLHMDIFSTFTKTLDEKQVEEWTAMVEKWEMDPHNAPNPYAVTTEGLSLGNSIFEPVLMFYFVFVDISLAQVRMELSQRDKDEERHTDGDDDDVAIPSPGKFMAAGLALELMMVRLATDIKNDPPKTPAQEEKVANHHMGLRTTINREIAKMNDPEAVELTPLVFPSALTEEVRKVDCPAPFSDYEWQLRWAAAHEALAELRHSVSHSTVVWLLLPLNAQDVKPLKIAWMDMEMQEKMKLRAKKRSARHQARELEEQGLDKGALAAMEMADGESESRRTISWIWMVPGSKEKGTDDKGSDPAEAVRIEWCCARARAQHWDEQCTKVLEETCCVSEFLDRCSKWWTANAEEELTETSFVSLKVQRGVRAYVWSQAEVLQRLGREFSAEWEGVFTELKRALGLAAAKDNNDAGEKALEGGEAEDVDESDDEGMDKDYMIL
ncbi:hypothetical protein M422DRAFT_47290 [Sphaerobolus stellatus SS14]|uniref:CxC2-like cysteine cluster KDZ transposase-associated domain-containing protein n=1 Tax=Sphaerobolus stellatus (strain SS14) TaxID=990650 RepID=A0A0C9VQG9_SPHS4|nr:hypothetical protein M422DRAFT_47290 [Sphaerobolus stellatus SS14]